MFFLHFLDDFKYAKAFIKAFCSHGISVKISVLFAIIFRSNIPSDNNLKLIIQNWDQNFNENSPKDRFIILS
jgi:hypothetical protein